MKRVVTLLLVLVVVVAGVPAAATFGGSGQHAVTQGTSVAPGQQFAGVVGVQGAEVRNSVQDRALAVRLEMASTNESTAAVVAREAADVEDRGHRCGFSTSRSRSPRTLALTMMASRTSPGSTLIQYRPDCR